jgi:inositol-phosphate phosphatase/L-galactose 1-phosphate phosphatase/histidinol-phosphatase
MFAGNDFTGFERLRKRVWHTVYGSECLAYGLLAMGFIDLVVEADLKPFDFCALVPVVKGAGGAMTDWQGQPLTLKSDGRVVASGDAGLLDAALAALAG